MGCQKLLCLCAPIFSLISDSLGGVTTYIIMKFLLWLGNVWSLDGGLKMDPSLPKSKIPTFILQYHGAPLHYTDLLSECNLVFTILFTIECAMKLSSFGYQVNYVLESLNVRKSHTFEHFVVCSFRSIWRQEKLFLEISWPLKFIYSEKATKFCEISTVDLTVTTLRSLLNEQPA